MSEEPITSPEHLDGVAYLYGHPLLNSLSPPLHQTVFDHLGLNWRQIPLSSVTGESATYPPPYTKSPPVETFLASIRANPKFKGASVTMPWKVAIMPHLDELTEDVRQAGACNTIYLKEGEEEGGKKLLVGTNTDCSGIRESLLHHNAVTQGRPALIVGGGGTARTAAYVLRKWLGASKIYIVNRDEAEVATILAEDAQRDPALTARAPLIHVKTPEEAAALDPPTAIVSGIPNYPPKSPEEITARETVTTFLRTNQAGSSTTTAEKRVILEMCYHPKPWTEIGQLAADAGWEVILGWEALLWQGLDQSRLWTGKDIVEIPGLVDKVKEMIKETIAERTKNL
ncbi:hypothetical protein ASPZODRAFT_58197 [Penicilliopsis zonata CBS 506.65]|uniref:Shikimate dehydrogenase substrate binding N-terminal domain-containing protein n=1 Tax=Penicilliopsis zonata CBS 506.65 TaxID=1073090 RepID=A0A1L9SRN5_9EURO|nr:hypothetical protein ASPZODRAFT_58197 [Penicilliopsis zonata CBS 506.65]OJJ49776.1 hypothetical protein ASPZODRAFT_58197 [Penicilliopsis zonata CBS 506.65]